MLFMVWVDLGGELPRNRGDLFARFVDALLDREHLLVDDETSSEPRYTPQGERLLTGLTVIAWRMQVERLASGQEAQDMGVLTVLPRRDALKSLGEASLLKKAEDATLLEGSDEIRFRHQLLQEYFTALALRSRIHDAAALWPSENWWERSGWEESAVRLSGLYAEDCAPNVINLSATPGSRP